jgi:hypothetical protein
VNLRNPRLQNDILASMTQEYLSFDWGDSIGNTTFINNPSSYDLQLLQIKRELSDSYSKFREMISSPSSTVDMQNQQIACYAMEHRDINDVNVKLLLRTLSSAGGRSSLQSFYSPRRVLSCHNLLNKNFHPF